MNLKPYSFLIPGGVYRSAQIFERVCEKHADAMRKYLSNLERKAWDDPIFEKRQEKSEKTSQFLSDFNNEAEHALGLGKAIPPCAITLEVISYFAPLVALFASIESKEPIELLGIAIATSATVRYAAHRVLNSFTKGIEGRIGDLERIQNTKNNKISPLE